MIGGMPLGAYPVGAYVPPATAAGIPFVPNDTRAPNRRVRYVPDNPPNLQTSVFFTTPTSIPFRSLDSPTRQRLGLQRYIPDNPPNLTLVLPSGTQVIRWYIKT